MKNKQPEKEAEQKPFKKGEIVTSMAGNGDRIRGTFWEDDGWCHWIEAEKYKGIKIACKPSETRREDKR